MPSVSFRTLVLTLELLAAVVALQYVTFAKPAKANTVWIATDGRTASSLPSRVADPAATAPDCVSADADAREP